MIVKCEKSSLLLAQQCYFAFLHSLSLTFWEKLMLKTTSFLGTALKNGNQKKNKLSQEAEFIITLQTQEFAIGK
jgi:hypothetical protein